MKYWKIVPLNLGKGPWDKSSLTYLRDPGVRIEIVYLAFLLICGDEKILVDTGPPAPVQMAPFHMPYSQSIEQTMEAQLARFHTRSEEIHVVVNTHLHWDHCYRNSLFKRPTFTFRSGSSIMPEIPFPYTGRCMKPGRKTLSPPMKGSTSMPSMETWNSGREFVWC